MKRSTFLALAAALPLSLFTFGCEKASSPVDAGSETMLKPGGSTVTANPAIAFSWVKDVQPGSGVSLKETIGVMNADGQAATNLYTTNGFLARHPSWSPSGSSISFMEHTTSGYSIRILDVSVSSSGVASGTVRSGAIATVSGGSFIQDQAWSPSTTASEIGYAVTSGSGSTLTGELKVTTLSGTTSTLYTSGTGSTIQSVAWNLDGSKIAFTEVTTGSGGTLKIIDRDGTNLQTVLTKTAGDFYIGLDWSRDDSQLAFSYSTTGSAALRRVVLSTGTETTYTGTANVPSWSPDDTKIAYYGGSTAGIRLLTLSTGATANLFSTAVGGRVAMMPDWKR